MAKLKITCTCPDFSQKQGFIVNSLAFSHTYDRDWSGTNAGPGEGRWCKHIWSAMLQRGEVTPDMIPNDVPIPVDRQALESITKELYQPGYRGHSFAPTVGVRGFRKWK